MAWLMYAKPGDGRDFVLNHFIPTFEERCAARDYFSSVPSPEAQYIAHHVERPLVPGSGEGLEPLVVR